RTALRAVDELVAYDERPELELGLERPRGTRADDPPHADLVHRPDVRAVRDRCRRQFMAAAVPWQERDTAAAPVPHHARRGRRAVGRPELHLVEDLDEGVEARAAEHTDLCLGHKADPRATRGSGGRRRTRAGDSGEMTPRGTTARRGRALPRPRGAAGGRTAARATR